MREKTKGAHIDSETAARQQKRRQQPGAGTAGAKGKKRLSAGPDHKTADMRKGHRGTFP